MFTKSVGQEGLSGRLVFKKVICVSQACLAEALG